MERKNKDGEAPQAVTDRAAGAAEPEAGGPGEEVLSLREHLLALRKVVIICLSAVGQTGAALAQRP